MTCQADPSASDPYSCSLLDHPSADNLQIDPCVDDLHQMEATAVAQQEKWQDYSAESQGFCRPSN